MKPNSIKVFQILAWCAVGFTAILLLLGLVLLMQYARYLPAISWILSLLQIALVVGLAISIPQVAQRRNPTGRVMFAALAAGLLLIQLVGLLMGRGGMDVITALLLLVMLGLFVAALIFLFHADSTAWLAQGRVAGAAYPGVGGGYPTAPGYPPQPTQSGGWNPPPVQSGAGASAGYPPAPTAGWTPPPPAQSEPSYPPAGTSSAEPHSAFPAPATSVPEPAGYPPAPEASSGPGQAPASGTRLCPYCAEEIKAEAIKCRYCGSAVEPVA